MLLVYVNDYDMIYNNLFCQQTSLSQDPLWWTWSLVPWTVSVLGNLVAFSVQTTTFLVGELLYTFVLIKMSLMLSVFATKITKSKSKML